MTGTCFRAVRAHPKAMKTKRTCVNVILLAAVIIALLPAAGADGAPGTVQGPYLGTVLADDKVLQVGDSQIIECSNLTRAAIGDPLIADVAALSSSEILVNGKTPGKTVLYIWDASGRRIFRILVQPAELDLAKLCADIAKELNDPRISVRGVGNTLILEGVVSREAEASRAEAIAQAVVETAIYHGTHTGAKSEEVKSVARPEGESFVLERVTERKESPVTAEVGLRCPKIVNLIQIEKSIDEVSVRTLETAAALRQALNDPALTMRALPGSVVMIEGKVGTDAELARIEQVVKGWVKEGADGKGVGPSGELSEKVTMVNAVRIDSSVARQVMVRAQVVDINRSALKDFGVDWGRVVSTPVTVGGVGTVATDVSVQDQPFLFGQPTLGPFDLFGGGDIFRFDPIGARVRALEQQNKAKVLSEPNLLVLDGREASILVGGEIPIPVVQSAQIGAAASVTIEYKEFGVRLKILPTITGDDRLQLKIMPEVSSLDFANAVSFSGFQIPAFRTRRAETTVNVKDGQSIIIGGLIQNETAKLIKKIPILGDLPVIGELFKTRNFVNNETELVIIITPQIVKAAAGAAAAK